MENVQRIIKLDKNNTFQKPIMYCKNNALKSQAKGLPWWCSG